VDDIVNSIVVVIVVAAAVVVTESTILLIIVISNFYKSWIIYENQRNTNMVNKILTQTLILITVVYYETVTV
jgi:hypothetical protein